MTAQPVFTCRNCGFRYDYLADPPRSSTLFLCATCTQSGRVRVCLDCGHTFTPDGELRLCQGCRDRRIQDAYDEQQAEAAYRDLLLVDTEHFVPWDAQTEDDRALYWAAKAAQGGTEQ